MKFRNSNIINVDCANCGKTLEAYFNEGYDKNIKETILCANCAEGEWERRIRKFGEAGSD